MQINLIRVNKVLANLRQISKKKQVLVNNTGPLCLKNTDQLQWHVNVKEKA
jgi:hypothetical protein